MTPDLLRDIFEVQTALQRRINDYDLADQSTAQRVANVTVNVLACTDELHEALNETSWKPWTTGEPRVNDEALKKEIIDAAHFLVNLALHAGMDADEFHARYMAKNAVNVRRQDEGYDGRSSKCPGCARDLADITLEEVYSLASPRFLELVLCGSCHTRIPLEIVHSYLTD